MKKVLPSSLQRLVPLTVVESVMDRLLWPSTGPSISFEDAVDHAILKKQPLFISSNSVINLSERILLKTNGSMLHIVGLSDDTPDARPLIISSAHSIFQVGGRGAALKIENMRLRHTCHRHEYKDIGGVIFALHKAKVEAVNCEMLSDHGFGIWAVQRASISLTNCRISSSSRSGCVSFGKSSLSMEGCTVYDCSIHGVCSRGTTFLSIRGCSIISSGIRGIYAYHNVSLSMTDTVVSGTKSCDHAAVDLWSCSPKSSCRDEGENDPEVAQADVMEDDLPAQTKLQSNQLATTLNIHNEVESVVSVVGKKDLKNLHSIDELRKNSIFSFELAGNATEGLHVNLLRCVISDNSGVGLKIRQGQPGSGKSRIRGSISQCNLHDNAQGNVTEILDETVDKPELNLVKHLQNSETSIIDVMLSAGSPTSVASGINVTKTDAKHGGEASIMVWEFERDDPAITSTGKSEVTGPLWQGYNPSVTAFIEAKYRSYQRRCGLLDATKSNPSGDADAASDIPVKSRRVNRSVKGDSEDSDNDSQCSAEPQSRKILLPHPYSRYAIDFSTMQQTNLETHYMRAVRCKEIRT